MVKGLFRRVSTVVKGESGDIPGWVMILLMTAALVVGIWTVASDRLIAIVSTALSTVCGGIGC